MYVRRYVYYITLNYNLHTSIPVGEDLGVTTAMITVCH